MVAVRRSTLEPLLAALRSADVDGIPDGFYFIDLNAKANYNVGSNDKLSLALYSGQDVLDLQFLDDGRFDIRYGNRTLSANWTHLFSDAVFANLTVTGSRYASTPEATVSGTQFAQENTVNDFSLKGDAEYVPGEGHSLKAGVWAGSLVFELVNTFDAEETFRQRIQSEYASFYVEDTYRPSADWEVRGGRFFGIADYELQIQLINTYGRRNVWFYFFEFEDDSTVERTEIPQLPVPIPNLSFSLTF